MPKIHFTDRFVATASAGDWFDDDPKYRGLNLRVADTSVRTWYHVFTSPKDKKRARFLFGRYPTVGLGRARAMLLESKAHLQDGRDPRDVGTASAGAMTVESLVADFLAKHVRPKLRSAKAVERRLVRNVLP